jgi:Tfp pilus assembly protein PilN
MRAVNLLPKKETRERRKAPNPAALGGVVAAVVVTAVMCVWFLTASAKVSERQAELDNIRSELAATPVPKPRDTRGDGLQAEKSARLAAVAGALGTRVPWDRVLRQISLVTPEDVWLTSLTASAPATGAGAAAAPATPTAGAGAFSINGRTYSHDAVARLLSRLSLVPDLHAVKLEKSTLTRVSGNDIVDFTIAANVRGKEAS